MNKSQERTVELTESEYTRLVFGVEELVRGMAQMVHEMRDIQGDIERIRRKTTEPDRYMTIAEAAEYVRVGKLAVYGWIKAGRVVAYAPQKGKMLVKKGDLDGLARRNRVDPEEGTGVHAAGREGLKAWHARRRAAAQEREQGKAQEATA